LFQLSATPADEELNNYISIEDLGSKNGADIFGKTMVCYKTFAQNTYVPGTPCVNGHTDPAVCDLHGDAAPIPGYYISGYTVMPYLCDNNPDPVITIPLEGGGGGWNGGSLPDPLDPNCETIKNNLQKAKTMYNDANVKAQNNIMKATIVTDAFEKAFYFGKNTSGTYATSPIINGSAASTPNLNIAASTFPVEGASHNHPNNGFTAFSPQDINGFNYYIHQSVKFKHLFVNGTDGSEYVFTVEDQFALDDFTALYPDSSIDPATSDWRKDLDIYKDEMFCYKYFFEQTKSEDKAYELTLAYLINKYNMGITMSKRTDQNGDFHPIHVEAITNQILGISYAYIQTNPCNL